MLESDRLCANPFEPGSLPGESSWWTIVHDPFTGQVVCVGPARSSAPSERLLLALAQLAACRHLDTDHHQRRSTRRRPRGQLELRAEGQETVKWLLPKLENLEQPETAEGGEQP
ncbi:MAG: hypothetical protein FJ125_16620 [Deltaproteobacteria bacterium]|nr:hypothetical protein [Deltaproteobacteria bacterium]